LQANKKEPTMSALGLSLIAFACIFGTTLLSMFVRGALPEHHLNSDSRDAIRLSMGVIGTMSALVLGLLIAKSSFDAKNSQVKQITANVILLDQLLVQYGPEAHDTRVLLRRSIASMADKIWSEGDQAATATGSFVVSAEAETFLNSVLNLKPQTDSQRSAQARAIKTLTDLAQTRLLLYTQSGNEIPLPFLVLLVFWLAIIFASFSLFVSPNSIVVFAFFVCAFSASGALFLIFELDRPFTGLMSVSDTALRQALAPL
jgi:hypothetical protein